MAHFALLDETNTVTQVVVISNDDCLDETGVESEEIGIRFCEQLFGSGVWKQTSYNRSFRGHFAGIGYRYLPEIDAFVPPQPRPWYVLGDNLKWVCPVGIHPQTGLELEDWQWEYLQIMDTVKIREDYTIQLIQDRGLM